jgi:branched-chain amino acid transport system substrate-binding protein
MDGTFYSTHYSPEDKAEMVQTFVKKFKARWNNEVPDAMAALGYDSALVLADAIKRAGGTDGQKLRDALAATKDFVGVTGKTTLDAKRNATKPAVIIEVKDGKFVYKETVNP